MVESLVQRFRQGDRLALARLLTLIARHEEWGAIDTAFPAGRAGASRVVAVTGSAGVGKSTLIGKLIELLRTRGTSVAVLACDPESSLTGGALLADRVRMPSRPDDPGVFIRSMTAASGHQGIADHLDRMICVLAAFPFDVVLLETAGAGQGDTAVSRLADAVVLLVQHQTGDEFQWEKAGLLEIADIVVVHKSDLPGSEQTEVQLRGLVNLPGCRPVPMLRVSSAQGSGLDELWNAVEALPKRRSGKAPDARALLQLALESLRARFEHAPHLVNPIVERWLRRELDERQASQELLEALVGPELQKRGTSV
jgi:LAO/AO transport system ATPase